MLNAVFAVAMVAQTQARDPFATLALPGPPAEVERVAHCGFHITGVARDADETVALAVVPTSGADCTPQVVRVGDQVTPHFGRVERIDDTGMDVITEYLNLDGDLVVQRQRVRLGERVDW